MARKRIFVSAYACEPGLGSEIGVGWHWVLEMSKYFDLWVLTRRSNMPNINAWLAENPDFSNINFIYYDLPKWARFWKKGLRGVRLYYILWQFCSNNIVKRTMIANNISIFHHLTYGNALWNVSRYGSKQTFIWGPVGGLETIPENFSRHYDTKCRIIEKFRRFAVACAKLNVGFYYRCKQADIILCKTEHTMKRIPRRFAAKALIFTDVAADVTADVTALPDAAINVAADVIAHSDIINGSNPPATHNASSNSIDKAINFISVGRLDAWRGFDLVLEAFAIARKKNNLLTLTIVGDGNDKSRLISIVDKLNISSSVSFTGNVPMSEYKSLMNTADVVVNAALKEGAVTVSFDAVSLGKPLICLDTTGYTRCFSEKYAVIIPILERDVVIDKIKDAMLTLANNEQRHQMSLNALNASSSLSWQNHGKQFRDILLEKLQIS